MATSEPLRLDLDALDVMTVELPGEDLVKALGMGLGNTEVGASGIARTTTVRAYTPDEFSKLAAEAPTM